MPKNTGNKLSENAMMISATIVYIVTPRVKRNVVHKSATSSNRKKDPGPEFPLAFIRYFL